MALDRISGSIVAIVTPFDSAGQVDQPVLEQLLRRQVIAGTSAVVIAGTTGEGAALSSAMFESCMAAARSVLEATEVALIAGIGSPSTARCLEQAELAASCGAQALLAVTPYYLKTTQAGLHAHFERLADQAGLPVILYNVPGRTALDLLAETTVRLSRHDNIVAIKEALPDMQRIQTLVAETSEDFAVLSGDDASAREAMALGADGVISVTANVLPGAMAELVSHCQAGRHEQAKKLDEVLAPLHQALMMEPNPIPVKAALSHLGLLENQLAMPLVPASAATKMILEELLNHSLAQWTGIKQQ